MRLADLALRLLGSASGEQIIRSAAAASGAITLPAGTTDFSATGGAGQVVKQATAGAAFTVAPVAVAEVTGAAPLASPSFTGTVAMGGALNVNAVISTRGVNAGYNFEERLIPGTNWTWYAYGGIASLWSDAAAASRLTVDASGNLAVVAGGLVGTATSNNAAAGNVGEYIASQVTYASRIGITSGVAANVASISLAAGDWHVGGSTFFAPTAGVTTCEASISTTSAVPADPSLKAPTGPNGGAGFGLGNIAPSYRLSLAATTTVYLVASVTLGSGTCQVCGILWGRRMR